METAPSVKILGETVNGYRADVEFKNTPVAFVNALRRILLADIPTVVVRDVQILNNTTRLIHEMLRHRIEMLPINVQSTEPEVIRDTKIVLRIENNETERIVTTDDFVITGPRQNVLLKDRELGTPLLFLTLKPGENIHIEAKLGLEMRGASQVCVSTYRFHVDPEDERVRTAKQKFVDEGGKPAVFDNFHAQRLYHTNPETRRPDWFDLTVESIGVTKAKDLLRKAGEILREKIEEWSKRPVLREEPGWYRVEADVDGHTIGNLVQQMMYTDENVKFVSYDIPHPLLPQMNVRFQTAQDPAAVLGVWKTAAMGLCKTLLETL